MCLTAAFVPHPPKQIFPRITAVITERSNITGVFAMDVAVAGIRIDIGGTEIR